MITTLLAIPTKTKILLLMLVGVIIITTIIIALQTPPSQEESTPAEQIQTNRAQRSIIGKKITPDTEQKLDIIEKQATDEGKFIYSLKSQNAIRTDQIITQDEQIIFERFYIPENPNDPNHLLISAQLKKYGNPEKVITGSKLWGPFINTYIYNSKGVAFIGNPNTDEVYELQNFTPLPIDEYIRLYGDDIDDTPPGGES